MKPLNRYLFGFAFFLLSVVGKTSNVLHLNSYGITYSWGDSVALGVKQTLFAYPGIHLYTEYLDAKRFGQKLFPQQYQFIKEKYHNLDLDIVIATDNDALEFAIKYGEELFPNIPIVFGGINNPYEYQLENTRFWGILEGVDQDSVNSLILKIIPNAKKLYFITDSTTTSLINLRYIKLLEPKYKNRVSFEYIDNIGLDSLVGLVKTLEVGNAIALLDIFQDKDNKPLNSDNVAQMLESISPIPIFIDSESTFGKGLTGGIINKGFLHGTDIALLAIELLNNPKYKPQQRFARSTDRYHFDYNILLKYNIDPKLLPANSIIINKPNSIVLKYLLYLAILSAVIAILITIIFILLLNIKKRKNAEKVIDIQLKEIRKKNEDLIIAKMKAEESDRLKSAFLGNISHEIRTPLNAIIGFSNLFQQEEDVEQQQTYSQIITKNSEQLLMIIEDIVEISELESGQVILKKNYFSINAAIDEVIKELSCLISDDSIKLTLGKTISNNEISIIGDQKRIKQVLRNLLSNAIKFTEKGIIEIDVIKKTENQLLFYVKDSGIGIRKEYADSIFGNFWKEEHSSKKLYGGTGVGLSISKGLIELMGGNIWFEDNEYNGCTFFFLVPIKKSPIE